MRKRKTKERLTRSIDPFSPLSMKEKGRERDRGRSHATWLSASREDPPYWISTVLESSVRRTTNLYFIRNFQDT